MARRALSLVVSLLAACGALLPDDPKNCAFLGRIGTFPAETVTRATCAPVYVVEHDGAITVFLARTPHLEGETLQARMPTRS